MRVRRRVVGCLGVALLAVGACGDADDEVGGAPSGEDAAVATSPDADAAPVAPAVADAAASEADAGGLGYLERCDPTDDRCAGSLTCTPFVMLGAHCSRPCAADDECEAPSTRCGFALGMCAPPMP